MKPLKYIAVMYYKLFAHDKAKFIIIGGLGFIINYAFLGLLYDVVGAPIIIAQICGAEIALLATFVGNNMWSFTDHHHVPLHTKLIKYHLSALGGLIINSTFVVILVKYAHVYYGLALVVGSIAGLTWNYNLYKSYVFKKKTIKHTKLMD